MVSFSCEACGDTIKKPKLDSHRNQCRGASFSCLDCSVHFRGTEYRQHTSCISEAQKYQGHLYRPEKDKKGKQLDKRKSNTSLREETRSMLPPGAYVEDAPEDDEPSNAIAVIEVPPRAPTPPPADQINVFDFLVSEDTPGERKSVRHAPDEKRVLEHITHYPNGDSQYSQYSQYSNAGGSQYTTDGYTYGHGSVQPTFERYESWHNLTDSQPSQLMPPPPYATPAPKHERKDKKEKGDKSEKKRKRHVEELDLSSAKRPASRDAQMADAPATNGNGRVLHSGLTGGLHKLLTTPGDFERDRIEAGPTPISPAKRSKHTKDARDEKRKSSYTTYSTAKSSTTGGSSRFYETHDSKRSKDSHAHDYHDDRHGRNHKHHDSFSSDDRGSHTVHNRRSRMIEYPDRPTSVQPHDGNRLVHHSSRAELFMSFVTKGPDSERGLSINKALKRYHREREVSGHEKEDEDKELWKNLRLRRNDRGEIVLFI